MSAISSISEAENLLPSPNLSESTPLGCWSAGSDGELLEDSPAMGNALRQIDQRLFILLKDDRVLLAKGGSISNDSEEYPVVGIVPACNLNNLGDASFCQDHGLKFPYVAGAMANGIGSVKIVEAMGKAGMIGFFGSAGLPIAKIEEAIIYLKENLGELPFGFNLIHSPNEQAYEKATVDLYLKYEVRLVEASAYLRLTPEVVRYRLHGIHRNAEGKVIAPNKIVAKASRIEVASKFFSPAPKMILKKLLEAGTITQEQAEMAQEIPVAQDISAEADSGGHTDSRPALTMMPTFLSLRDRMQAENNFDCKLRVGLGGGISTPASAAAAFAMGAAYVLTGSVNQACIESGTSDLVRDMLAECRQADVIKAPAADMFEMGVEVQVLKRGTMFAMRGHKLYDLYRNYDSWEAIPEEERKKIEEQNLRMPFEEAWEQCIKFFAEKDRKQIDQASDDPKHRMALVFRSYLGQASGWANRGVADRKIDFQIWCGPAMGAFNEWVKGTFLEKVENRKVVTIGQNILRGAAIQTRLNNLASQGVKVPGEFANIQPVEPGEL